MTIQIKNLDLEAVMKVPYGHKSLVAMHFCKDS